MKFLKMMILSGLVVGSAQAQEITSVIPNSASQGEILDVTITGANTITADVWFSQGSLTITPVSGQTQSNTSMTAKFDIAANAAVGLWSVNVQQINDQGIVTLQNGFVINAAIPVPAAPLLISPADDAVVNDNTPTFTWSAPLYADRYRLQLDDEQGFSSPLLDKSDLTESAYTLQTPIADGTLFWRVQAKNSSNIWGEWSPVSRLTIDATARIVDVSPDNALQGETLSVVITGENTFFSESSVAADMWFSQGSLTIQPVSGQTPSSTSRTADFSIAAGTPTGLWNVNVRQSGENGVVSLQNGFTINPGDPLPVAPALTSPLNNAIRRNYLVTFAWSKPQYASAYGFQVANDTSFTSLVIDMNELSDTNFTTLQPLSNNVYYWRVRARNNSGFWGAWSPRNQLTIMATPAINQITPDKATQGQSLTVTIVGDNTFFAESSTMADVRLVRGAETIQPVSGETTSFGVMTAIFNIDSSAAVGKWDVHVQQEGELGEVVLLNGFTIESGTVLAVQGATDEVPADFEMSQNFPNPFNPSTEIQFQIPRKEHIEIRIFNLLGEKVRTLVDDEYGSGYHRLNWNGKNDYGIDMPSGIYFYRIAAGSFVDIKKMSLLR
jgi:hypothetical protein